MSIGLIAVDIIGILIGIWWIDIFLIIIVDNHIVVIGEVDSHWIIRVIVHCHWIVTGFGRHYATNFVSHTLGVRLSVGTVDVGGNVFFLRFVETAGSHALQKLGRSTEADHENVVRKRVFVK